MRKLNIEVYDGQVEENFNIDEFRCPANGEILLNKQVLEHINRLQRFRVWYNRAMIVDSGYRTREYNSTLKGASPKSQHMNGLAADIRYPNEFWGFSNERKLEFLTNIRNKWESLCIEDGVRGGVGWYNGFFHLDSRVGVGKMAFWNFRTE